MKFSKVSGENFKNFGHIEFSPTKKTCAFIGPNGTGKTTLTQIIRFALTGECPDDAIKAGKDGLSVTMTLSDGSVIERSKSYTKPSQVKVNDRKCTGKALSAYIESVSGVPMDSLKLSSSGELIENMKPEEFGDFIMKYIPEQLDYEVIKGFLNDADPRIFPVLQNDEVIPQEGKFGYDQLQTTYDYLFNKRKIVRSNLQTYEAKTANVELEKPELSLKEVNEQIEKLLKEEGAFANAKRLVEAYNKAVDAKNKQQEQIKVLEEKIASISAECPDPAKKIVFDTKKKELNSSIVSLKSTISTLNNNISMFKKTLQNLDSSVCPLSKNLVCKTDKTESKKEFEEQIAENKKSIEAMQKEVESKQKEFDSCVKEEEKYNENDKKYREKSVLIQQLENTKKTLITLPEKPEAVNTSVNFTEEKERLYKVRNSITQYEQYVSDFNKFTALKAEKEVLDILVQLFAPKGEIALKVTKHYFGVFEDLCNERASELKPGFTLKFVPENGIKILCETSPGVGYIPYWSCSSGERAFVIFLLTDLISGALTKSNIMILDDLDKLDADAFKALVDCIMQSSVQDSYDHIFICAVNHEGIINTLNDHKDIEITTI